jgi:hypothetical protein
MEEEQKQHLIATFKSDIIKLNNQRKRWLAFSSVVFVAVILIIFFSEKINQLHYHSIWWLIGSIGLIVSINWWYWTLTLIRRVLQHQIDTVIILSEITSDVKSIKTDINELYQKGIIE